MVQQVGAAGKDGRAGTAAGPKGGGGQMFCTMIACSGHVPAANVNLVWGALSAYAPSVAIFISCLGRAKT